jgi:hypothetical protein
MIKVRIVNGSRLGNILFQYAAGRALAVQRQEELTLDFREYINWLDVFGFKVIKELSYFDLQARIYNPLILKTIKKTLNKIKNEKEDVQALLNTRSFSEDFFKRETVPFIQGYFQSEKYFSLIAGIIRNDLRLKEFRSPGPAFDELKHEISASNSVAIHVRRGDYVKSVEHTTLAGSYYARAIDYFRQLESTHAYFIFSDDIAWCKNNLKNPDFTFVDLECSKHTSIFDFSLMSLCRHQIIANSMILLINTRTIGL